MLVTVLIGRPWKQLSGYAPKSDSNFLVFTSLFVSGSGTRGLALSFILPGRDALELAVPIAFVTMSEENLQQVQDNMLAEFERGLETTANAATNQVSENNASQTSTLSREWESVSVNNTSVSPLAASAATVPEDPWQGKELPRQAQ